MALPLATDTGTFAALPEPWFVDCGTVVVFTPLQSSAAPLGSVTLPLKVTTMLYAEPVG